MKHIDTDSNNAVIEHRGSSLSVDLSLVDYSQIRLNSLYMLIGEVEMVNEELVLKVRIVSNVDGLDISLFEKALVVRCE